MIESPFDWQFPYPSQRMPVLARRTDGQAVGF